MSGTASTERDDRGAAVVEYAVLDSLIAVVCIAAVTYLGSMTSTTLSSVGDGLTTAGDVEVTVTTSAPTTTTTQRRDDD